LVSPATDTSTYGIDSLKAEGLKLKIL